MPRTLALALLACSSALASAAELTVTVNQVDANGVGAALGSVRIVETRCGLAFYPSLKGLPAGVHGFHVHEKPSCAPADKDGRKTAAGAAGDHLDPAGTRKHGEPWGDGHLGDLPAIYVAADGSATTPVLAPRLKLADVRQRALIAHLGGDNHSDHPAPAGGGGERLACGVIGG